MKKLIFTVVCFLLLTVQAQAVELPEDLMDAVPEEAEDLLDGQAVDDAGDLAQGIGGILERLGDQAGAVIRARLRGAAAVLLVAVLCGAAEGFGQGTGGSRATVFLPMVGALSVTLLTAGSLDDLIGLGSQTIRELSDFSQTLLPTLAAATAASGAVTTATVQQVTTVFLSTCCCGSSRIFCCRWYICTSGR